MLIDPNGEFDTDYRNQQGELLYQTNDGLKQTIIVPEENTSQLKEKLQTAQNNGTADDPEFNKEELHKLGQTPQQYVDEKTKGTSENWKMGYSETYEKSYKEGKGVVKDNFSFSQIISAIVSALATDNKDNSGKERHAGRTAGISDGNSDKDAGRINRLNPESSFKNNAPLIILKTKKD